MIIDARTEEAVMIAAEDYTGQEYGRSRSMKGAVRAFLAGLAVGSSRPVAGLVDADGNSRDVHLRSMVSQYARETGKLYATRDMKDGNLCHVFRIK